MYYTTEDVQREAKEAVKWLREKPVDSNFVSRRVRYMQFNPEECTKLLEATKRIIKRKLYPDEDMDFHEYITHPLDCELEIRVYYKN
jgi:hypothetical protein